jgi:hypothetical protein
MKKYIAPEIDIVELDKTDIIATSDGVNTPKVDEDDPVWDLNIGG